MANLSRVILLLTVALLAACPGKKPQDPETAPPPQAAAANTSDPQWVVQNVPRAPVAVVFIHGVFGDTLDTWKAPNGVTFFQLLKDDPVLGGKVDLFAFGYTSKMLTQGSFNIDEAARRLRERLEYNGVLDYPAIVFVAHSMGGLVTLRTLLTYRELLPRVPLIALYGTPQEGSQIADIGRHISPNPALQQMIPGDKNLYLQALDNDWKEANRAKPIPVVCAYEVRDTYKIKIVPRGSATRYCTEPSSAIDADHLSIVKPDRPGHDSIVLLVNALNRHVVGRQWAAKMELPDFRREGDNWVFELTDLANRQSARLVNAGRLPLRYTIAELSDPGLHVWPDDTPRTVAGEGTESLKFALGHQPRTNQFRFLLRADGAPEERVTVRVPNLPQLLQQQAAMTGQLTADLNALLADDTRRTELQRAAPGDPAVVDTVLETARRSVEHVLPDAPASLQWVVTAEVLNATNWSSLAVSALRRAEAASPTVARLPSVARTAAWIAASSGESQVFREATNPIVPTQWTLPVSQSLAPGIDPQVATQLAARCEGIADLRGPCFILKGDLAERRGDTAAARSAFEESARVRMTPTLTERLRRQAATVAVPNAVVVNPMAIAVVPMAPINPAAIRPEQT
jgi:pimeloyl-ACP methyl ester carboxylesterase